MLARRSKLSHPLGAVIELPKLVPAFSSKGFPVFKEKGREKPYSEVAPVLEGIGPLIYDSILISAYDLHHVLLRRPQRFYKGKELIFIDSGGYELSPEWDSTEPKQDPYNPLQEQKKKDVFSLADYQKVLNKLSKNLPFVIANFDWKTRDKPVEEQIIEAQKLFNKYEGYLHNFLLKPGSKKYLA